MFLTGAKNLLFDPESQTNAFNTCCSKFPKQHYELLIVPKYGHIDWLLGKFGDRDVHPKIIDFIQSYATANHKDNYFQVFRTVGDSLKEMQKLYTKQESNDYDDEEEKKIGLYGDFSIPKNRRFYVSDAKKR